MVARTLGLVSWLGADTAGMARLVAASSLERLAPRLASGSE